jgi:exosortase A-associated hydrolase 2
MLQAGYLEGERGPLFYVQHPPASARARGAVLYVHPFAEELNKSRRMAALQARRFAAAGYAVLLPDHYGCGDSGGDFGDARWEVWREDLVRCAAWLGERHQGPLILWGLRSGCLLIDELLRAGRLDPAALLFWQPVANGEQYLTQFLRLRVAAAMLGGQKETTAELRQRLGAGEALEVAGYQLDPALAGAMADACLSGPYGVPLCWLEISLDGGAEISAGSRRVLDAWSGEGAAMQARGVPGEPFWATQEISEVAALLDASSDWLTDCLADCLAEQP